MAASSQQFPALYMKGLKEVTINRYKAHEPVWQQFFQSGTMDGYSETILGMAGIGRMERFHSGQPPTADQLTSGYTATFIRSKYGKQLSFEEDAIFDDRYAILGKEWAAAFGESARNTEDQIAADILNNGFSGSYVGPDGVSLFNASHPQVKTRYGISTWSNTDTGAALSTTSLKNGIVKFMKIVNDEGERINMGPAKLLIPVDLRWDAYEITKSMYLPGGSTNNANSLQGVVEVVEWPRLSSATAWFLMTEKSVPGYGLKFLWRRKLRTSDWQDNATRDRYYQADMAFAVGWTDGRRCYGNAGA